MKTFYNSSKITISQLTQMISRFSTKKKTKKNNNSVKKKDSTLDI